MIKDIFEAIEATPIPLAWAVLAVMKKTEINKKPIKKQPIAQGCPINSVGLKPVWLTNNPTTKAVR